MATRITRSRNSRSQRALNPTLDGVEIDNVVRRASEPVPESSLLTSAYAPGVFVARIQVRCDAFLFDLDGVLIDSTPAVARVWIRWAGERGFDPDSVVRRAHGRPSLTTIRELLPNSDHELENRELERREIEDLEGVVPLPGTAVLLSALPGNCWTIVTSSTRSLAAIRLQTAGLPAPARFITSSDVVNGKPHPEPFLRAAALLATDPLNCIVVEDAPAGVLAGKAAGARVLAFPTTVREAELRQAGADWIAQDCAAITLQKTEPQSPRLTVTLHSL